MNAGIQGLAADLFKVALVRLDAGAGGGRAGQRLVLQVHDEVLVEVVPGEDDEVAALTEQALTGAADLSVPLEGVHGLGQLLGGRQRGLSRPTRPRRRRPATLPCRRRWPGHPVVYRIPTRSPLPAGGAAPKASSTNVRFLPEAPPSCPPRPWAPSTRTASTSPAPSTEDDLGGPSARGRHGRHHRRVRRRRPGRGHGRQDRPGRGPARHRLQVRGRHPGPRALHPQRRRPLGDRHPGRRTSRPSSSRRRTRRGASSSRRSGPSTSGPGAPSRSSRKPTRW